MTLYFKNRPKKVFLGLPIGWPLLLCFGGLAALGLPLWLLGWKPLAALTAYPLVALLTAMVVDKSRRAQAAQ